MKFIDYNTYLFESAEDHFKSIRYQTEYGWIDYHYEVSDEYPNGLLVDLGGFVYPEYRRQGKLRKMLKHLLSSVPKGTTVQMAVASKKLFHMFKRIGFTPVKRIEYWGNVSHGMESIITQELIDAI
jgi:hypothetical protein